MKHRFRHNRNLNLDLGVKRSGRPGKCLLTEGILASNIDATEDGQVRIALWREWRAMLEGLQDLGPVWSIVRNGHCVLAVQGDYPKLTFSPDQQSANACDSECSLACHLPAWRRAIAFDSACNCGRVHGLEFQNAMGEIFHRVCLAKESGLTRFAEWIQLHQATGLEIEDPIEPISAPDGLFLPTMARPGTLQFSAESLRTVLITAAQRKIQLIASVLNEGIIQTARLDVLRASEARGWIALSGHNRSLYVESEPKGSLVLEPGTLEGESLWRLSLIDSENHRVMRLQSGVDSRPAWNQLIREIVIGSP